MDSVTAIDAIRSAQEISAYAWEGSPGKHRPEVIGLSSGGKDYLTWCLAYSSGVNLPAFT